jgi:signal transduction histidine kinase
VSELDRRDLLLAAAVGAGAVVEVCLSSHRRGPLVLDVLLTLLISGTLAVRRRLPLVAVVVAATGLVLAEATLTQPSDRSVPVLIVVALAYSVARWSLTRRAGIGLAVLLVTATTLAVIDDPSVESVLFPDVFFVWVPFLAGRTLRHRTELARTLADRAARLEREREEAAARGILDERRSIARELHDVVAHSVSVMVVQAGAGRRLAERDPERAAECAAQIEQVGRDALGELRRLLGVMRTPSHDGAILAPQPSFARLGDLVQNARDAGLSVEVRTTGDPATLPAGVDLAAYRIVQEALINTLKHAGPVHAQVLVHYGPDALELEVSDDGHVTAAEDVGGHGLIGMRERAALCGGRVSAGPGASGGYVVRARLPLSAEAVAA